MFEYLLYYEYEPLLVLFVVYLLIGAFISREEVIYLFDFLLIKTWNDDSKYLFLYVVYIVVMLSYLVFLQIVLYLLIIDFFDVLF